MEKIIKTVKDYDNLVNCGKLCVIDLFATWCGPCRMLAPIISSIANKSNDSFIVAKVDVDEIEEIAIRYSVNTIPTILYVKDGKLLEKTVGLRTEDQIMNTIEKYI
ncbi:MAG: thioredoxin [Clostridia bacterium]|nr:thioredoxin [Clostridia bacterium]